jgi:hypothetical protein
MFKCVENLEMACFTICVQFVGRYVHKLLTSIDISTMMKETNVW